MRKLTFKIVSLIIFFALFANRSVNAASCVSLWATPSCEYVDYKNTSGTTSISSGDMSRNSLKVGIDNDLSNYYNVTYVDGDWKNFKTHKEMVDACQLGKKTIDSLTTQKLFDIVMAYPLISDIYLYDSIDDGIQAVAKQFDGLNSLLNREDFYTVLKNKYINNNLETISQINYNKYTIDEIEQRVANEKSFRRKIYEESIVDARYTIEENILNDNASFEKYSKEDIKQIVNKVSTNSNSNEYFLDTLEEKSQWKNNKTINKLAKAKKKVETVYMKTPKGTKVKCTRTTPNNKNSNKDVARQKAVYPEATFIGVGYSENNCHAYAWTGTQDIWMNDPSAYVSDGSYVKTNRNNRPTANGQKALWAGHRHSAIVTDYTKQDPIVTSKWGGKYIWKCHAKYCPYDGSITYYKRS